MPIRGLAGILIAAASFGRTEAQPPSGPAERLVVGRAVDQDGVPVAGAAVHVTDDPFFDTAAVLAGARTKTDAEGRYRVHARRDKFLRLIVAAKGRQVCILRLLPEVRGEQSLSDAILLPGTDLRGRVRRADGAPLAGARIRVESAIVGDRLAPIEFGSGAVAGGDGIFVVHGVPTTGLRVRVSASGHGSRELLAAHHSPLDVSLEHLGLVRGRVVGEDGAPLSGIDVHGVTVESAVDGAEIVASDADGRFTLTVPKKDRFRVAGSERAPPYRRFSSGLLRGAADDVLVTLATPPAPRPAVTIECRDAATGAPIPVFWASMYPSPPERAQLAFLHHLGHRREYRDSARLHQHADASARPSSLVVSAPGHGFEIVPFPTTDAPLVLSLGPQSFLTGCVVDAATGQPMAGVAVQALPWGNAMGGGGDPARSGARTDAEGRYRLGGLRPGSYAVQAYAEDRPASSVYGVRVAAEAEAVVDLEVPKARRLELSLDGHVPAGPFCQLLCWATFDSRFEAGLSNPWVTSRVTVPLGPDRTRTLQLGPLASSRFQIRLWKPSRVRLGSGTTLDLATIEHGVEAAAIRLPELRSVLARGHVRLPAEVPPERVGVLAHPLPEVARTMLVDRPLPQVAGLDADAGFVLDLPLGEYFLQLVDLETGIVFHTETETRLVDAEGRPLDLAPAIHWLELGLAPTVGDGDVVLRALLVDLPSPGVADCSAFLDRGGRTNATEHGRVPFRIGATRQRWLVPRAEITVRAVQAFEILRPWAQGYQEREVDAVTVDVTSPVHEVRLATPPPPSDEELLRAERK